MPTGCGMKTSHEFSDFIYWAMFFLIPGILAGYTLFKASPRLLMIYLGVAALCFVLLYYRFFCTKCPHYHNSEGGCKCMFIWGLPKVFKPSNEPYRPYELLLAIGGILIIVAFPVYWLLAYPILLVVYLLAFVVFGLTMLRYECPHCIHSNCPSRMNYVQRIEIEG